MLISNKKHLKNVGPIHHCDPPHANSPDVASGTVARRLRIDVYENADDDNAWQGTAMAPWNGPNKMMKPWNLVFGSGLKTKNFTKHSTYLVSCQHSNIKHAQYLHAFLCQRIRHFRFTGNRNLYRSLYKCYSVLQSITLPKKSQYRTYSINIQWEFMLFLLTLMT